jgi:hypothetical protein
MQGVGSLDTAINPQVASVRPSKTMVMTDLAREMREAGVDVIALTAGEPDFDTPAPILEAGREALRCAPARAPPELQHQRLSALRAPLWFSFMLWSLLPCSCRCVAVQKPLLDTRPASLWHLVALGAPPRQATARAQRTDLARLLLPPT